MENLYYRQAVRDDLDDLLSLYNRAIAYMRENGNLNQWKDGEGPNRISLRQDIDLGRLWILEDKEGILAVFALVFGREASYEQIEGDWLDDRLPYATIHRMISSGRKSRIFDEVSRFCLSRHPNIRVDTHADNRPMIRAIERNGYSYCGVVTLEDGSERLAYQRIEG